MAAMPSWRSPGTNIGSSARSEGASGAPCACLWSCTTRARTASCTHAMSANTTWRHGGTALCVRYLVFLLLLLPYYLFTFIFSDWNSLISLGESKLMLFRFTFWTHIFWFSTQHSEFDRWMLVCQVPTLIQEIGHIILLSSIRKNSHFCRILSILKQFGEIVGNITVNLGETRFFKFERHQIMWINFN